MSCRTGRLRRAGGADGRSESGVAMVVAIAVAFVVLLLSTAAITETVNGIRQSGIANKQVTSTDAAEAGIQYAINQVRSAAAGNGTFLCTQPTAAKSGNFTVSDRLTYQTIPGPITTSAQLATSLPASPAVTACSGSVILVPNTTYDFTSIGTTNAVGLGAKTEQALVYVPSVVYAPAAGFGDADFAYGDTAESGSFSVSGGNSYTGLVGDCVNGSSFGGDYYDAGYNLNQEIPGTLPLSLTLPGALGGSCSVAGSLYTNNGVGVALGSNSGVGGSIYSIVGSGLVQGLVGFLGTGGVTVTGGTGVHGDIWSQGPVTLSSGNYGGNVSSAYGSCLLFVCSTSVTLSGGVTVAGNVYAPGNVVIQAGATVSGNVYAGGSVFISGGASVKGTTNQTNSVSIQGYSGSIASVVTSIATAAVNTEAEAVNGTTSTTVTFPQLTFDQTAWTDNINSASHAGFCAQSVPCTSCTTTLASTQCPNGSVRFVTDNDCSVVASGALDPASVWAVVASMEQAGAPPTVIQTSCRFDWDDPNDMFYGSGASLEGNTIKLYNSLAIFDTAGFDIPSTMTGGFTSADGSSHQLFLISPSTTGPFNGAVTLANPILSGIVSLFTGNPAYPTGLASCDLLTGPDISLGAPLTDGNIQDFVYTPGNVCDYGNTVKINGKVYAGGSILSLSTLSSPASWTQTFNTISPWATTSLSLGQGSGPSGTGPSTLGAVVELQQQVATATGT
jgi:Tfp pilus assembly protein PilX